MECYINTSNTTPHTTTTQHTTQHNTHKLVIAHGLECYINYSNMKGATLSSKELGSMLYAMRDSPGDVFGPELLGHPEVTNAVGDSCAKAQL